MLESFSRVRTRFLCRSWPKIRPRKAENHQPNASPEALIRSVYCLQVDRRLAIDLELFSRGGLKILEKIERQDYDVLRARPVISKTERVGLLLGALTRRAFSRAA